MLDVIFEARMPVLPSARKHLKSRGRRPSAYVVFEEA